MNTIDIMFTVLLVLGALNGLRVGAISHILGFTGGTVMLWVASAYAGTMVASLGMEPGLIRGVSAAIMAGVLMMVGVLVGQGAGGLLVRLIHEIPVLRANRILGMLTGVLGSAITIWLVTGMLVQGPITNVAQSLRESVIITTAEPYLPPTPFMIGRLATVMDLQGLPQAVADITMTNLPPETGKRAVMTTVGEAEAAGRPSTVRVISSGCPVGGTGSGVAVDEGRIVTTAHAIAGADLVEVEDIKGRHSATVIAFDPMRDLAVLDVPDSTAYPLALSDAVVPPGTFGAALGFPRKQDAPVVRPIVIRGEIRAVGRDMYGEGLAPRQVYVVEDTLREDEAGGPLITDTGAFVGIMFAGYGQDPNVAFGVTQQDIRMIMGQAGSVPVNTGHCRFVR